MRRAVSKWKAGLILCLAFCVFFSRFSAADELHSDDVEKNVCVLVSRELTPFLEAVESIRQTFSTEEKINLFVFNLPPSEETSQRDVLIERLKLSTPNLIIAVGSLALQFIKDDLGDLQCYKLYTLVLNPDAVTGNASPFCGVSLNMPVEKQLRSINAAFPKIRTVGIPYNPPENTPLAEHIKASALEFDISIRLIPIRSKSELPAGLESNWRTLDALWLIPDKVVTFPKSLIRYIIKEAFANGVPVFGYNSFFYESGAALSFVIDYNVIGVQTARLADRVLNGEACQNVPPEFETRINPKAVKSIGLELDADRVPGGRSEKNGG